MATIPICYKLPYKDHTLPSRTLTMQHQSYVSCKSSAFAFGYQCSSSSGHGAVLSRCKMARNAIRRTGISKQEKADQFQRSVLVHHRTTVLCSSVSGTNEKQLRSLDTYFNRLGGDANHSSSVSCKEAAEKPDTSCEISTKAELDLLNSYLGKLPKEEPLEKIMLPSNTNHKTEAESSTSGRFSTTGNEENTRTHTESEEQSSSGWSQSILQNEETSDLYLINALASISIAVFLFEIASPVKNSEYELLSLPLLYGAKINDLILVGEWWRLITPMFLHSGVFHVALGCWSLLTFGPQVCRGYGTFTFFLIYILGGLFGNLTSYLHTPGSTVGGTGPIFALIGAWLIYQTQNKDVTPKEIYESLFQKAAITTGLSFILSHFGPIDDWTHLGAVVTGITYGFLTCPMLQFDDASSRSGQDEGITLIRRNANPWKSLAVFAIFILLFSALVFLVEPPLDRQVLDDIDYFIELQNVGQAVLE